MKFQKAIKGSWKNSNSSFGIKSINFADVINYTASFTEVDD